VFFRFFFFFFFFFFFAMKIHSKPSADYIFKTTTTGNNLIQMQCQ